MNDWQYSAKFFFVIITLCSALSAMLNYYKGEGGTHKQVATMLVLLISFTLANVIHDL